MIIYGVYLGYVLVLFCFWWGRRGSPSFLSHVFIYVLLIFKIVIECYDNV